MALVLNAPLTLDPQQAYRIKIKVVHIDFANSSLIVFFDLCEANGNVLAQRSMVLDGAVVATWINNQKNNLYQRLMDKLGLTGTIE